VIFGMQGFREAVDVCNLLDLGYKGHFWTWEKKVTGGTYTRVRLDRALGSAEWSAQFPLAFVTQIMFRSEGSNLSKSRKHTFCLMEVISNNVQI
jgi:hypothetical protein